MRLPEDDADTLKHIGVLTYIKIVCIYIYIYIYIYCTLVGVGNKPYVVFILYNVFVDPVLQKKQFGRTSFRNKF